MKAIAAGTLTVVTTAGGTLLGAAALVLAATPGVLYYMVRVCNRSTARSVTVGDPGITPVFAETGTTLPMASAAGAEVSADLGPYSVAVGGSLGFITSASTAAVGYTVYALTDESP